MFALLTTPFTYVQMRHNLKLECQGRTLAVAGAAGVGTQERQQLSSCSSPCIMGSQIWRKTGEILRGQAPIGNGLPLQALGTNDAEASFFERHSSSRP